MKTLKILKINPFSAFKVGLGIGALTGIIFAFIYIVAKFVNGISLDGLFWGIGKGIIGVFTGIFTGFIYMLFIAISFLIYSIIYNIIARHFGAIEIEIRVE